MPYSLRRLHAPNENSKVFPSLGAESNPGSHNSHYFALCPLKSLTIGQQKAFLTLLLVATVKLVQSSLHMCDLSLGAPREKYVYLPALINSVLIPLELKTQLVIHQSKLQCATIWLKMKKRGGKSTLNYGALDLVSVTPANLK